MPADSSAHTMPVRASTELGEAATPPSPYLTAGNLRANAYLDLAKTLTNYRLLALALLAVDLVLVGTVVWQSTRTRITPYVVELDAYGNAVAFGAAERLASPDHALLVHEISRWVRHVRTVTLDPEVQRRSILDAYAYTGARANRLLNDFFRHRAPFALAERATVSVQVTSVLALTEAERTFQVQWRESEREISGGVEEISRWQALITVDVDPPERVEEVVTNPLGIRVVDFDWTRLPDPDNHPGGTP